MIRTILIAGLALGATCVQAQPVPPTLIQPGPLACFPAALVAKGLLDVAGEQQVMEAITKAGSRFLVYSTADGSTWTAVIVMAKSELSCTLAARNLELRHVAQNPVEQPS